MSGQLIVLEGPDGAGKSTLAASVVRELNRRGHKARTLGLPGNEPGTLGNLVHRLHHDPQSVGIQHSIDPAALQILHAGSHIDTLAKLIQPTIRNGESVILDRYWWSTQVYGRVAGVDRATLSALEALATHHWAELQPRALFLLLDSPVAVEAAAFAQLREAYEDLVTREWAFPVIRIPTECLTSAARLDFVLGHLG